MQLRDRTFLVTGGASGLGEACVRRLVREGARVVFADLNETAGIAVAASLGPSARFVRTDVTDENSVQAAIATATSAFGSLHGSIQCAGIVLGEKVLGRSGPHTLGGFSKVIQVNLIGTFNVVRLAAAAMEKNEPGEDGERGVLINTASVAAFEGQIGQAAYAASKGGVASMTLPIARELAAKGIRVAAIAPGLFDTPLLASLPEPVRVSLGQQTPFPARLGKPEEYADLAMHILTNRMINGCVLRLDGAIRMAAK